MRLSDFPASLTDGGPIHGHVKGSKGAIYNVTTDEDGNVTCGCWSCLSSKAPLARKWCKHLVALMEGRASEVGWFPLRKGTALAAAEEIREGLERIERELTSAQDDATLARKLDELRSLREKAHAFVDLLQGEIEAIESRARAAETSAKARL